MTLYGPVRAAGDWYGLGHVIVLTGIDGDTLRLNDPDDRIGGDDGRRGTEAVQWFNHHLFWALDRCMMYKPAK
ncbi:papain-like cysteine protease family protein [Neoroseomonas soli]|uniref:Uncharacterized protein n=1 Tax=Neoroseomonas soli TaxID=1081025 RepID=A0A9X9WVE7_9PROT|nr:papain-like cysteine protease family protein [Neoroseomonas soli]MBR0671126.1 hypothetical protein [Neoroseomonas soli]